MVSGKLLWLASACACLLIGCSRIDKSVAISYDIDAAAEAVELGGKVAQVDTIAVNPLAMAINDRYLMVKSRSAAEQFAVFSLDSLRHLYSGGSLGHALSEFQPDMDLKYFRPTSRGFEVFTVAQSISQPVAVTDTALWIETDAIAKHDFGMPLANGYLWLSDTLCLASAPGSGSEVFVALNPQKGETRCFGNLPQGHCAKSAEDKMFAYMRINVAKPDGSMFASFYYYLPVFQIYGSDGQLKREVTIDGMSDTVANRWVSAKAADEGIYALLPAADGRAALILFGWDGMARMKYVLDHQVVEFALDTVRNRIIGFSIADDNFHIYPLLP